MGCFLTPPSAEHYAYPHELEVEIEEELGGKGEYIFDIPNFRQQGMEFVLDQVFKMTERRFKVARRLLKDKPWDFFMMVEMGMDRLHHVFWHYFDPKHPLYKPGNPFEDAFQRYYRSVDDEVGALLDAPPRRRDHDRDERPWRPADDGRHLLQRLAHPERLPDA